MKSCPECKAEMEDKEEICSTCGHELSKDDKGTEELIEKDNVKEEKTEDITEPEMSSEKPEEESFDESTSEKEIVEVTEIDTKTKDRSNAEEEPDNVDLKQKKSPVIWIVIAVVIIGVFMLFSNMGKKTDTQGDKTPLLYFKIDANGENQFRVTGQGMKQEAVFDEKRLYDSGLPIIFSDATGETAYIDTDKNLYRMTASDLSGSTENQEKYVIAQGVEQLVTFSPDGKYVFFQDASLTLWVNDGKETKIIDENAIVQRTEVGWSMNSMNNGRIVYIRESEDGNSMELVTKLIDGENTPQVIALTGAHDRIEADAKGIIYYLEQPYENLDLGNQNSEESPEDNQENPEKNQRDPEEDNVPAEIQDEMDVEPSIVPSLDNTSSSIDKALKSTGGTLAPMSSSVDGEMAADGETIELTEEQLEALLGSMGDQEGMEDGEGVTLTEEQLEEILGSLGQDQQQEEFQEPMRISGYYYDIESGKSTLISEDMSTVLWHGTDKKVIYVEILPDENNERGFHFNLGYFNGTDSTILQENIGNEFSISEEDKFIIYDAVKNDESTFYLQTFAGDILPERIEVGVQPENKYYSFGTAKNRSEIYQFVYDMETMDGEMMVIPVGKDGVLEEPRLSLKELDSVMYYQVDGQPLILKNMSEDGMFADLYLVKSQEEELLLGENVWLPSLSGITEEMVSHEDVVMVVMDKREYTDGERVVGNIISYYNGETRVIGTDVGIRLENGQSTLIYRSPNLMYYWDAPENGQSGKLYRYTGNGKTEHISGNVQQAF